MHTNLKLRQVRSGGASAWGDGDGGWGGRVIPPAFVNWSQLKDLVIFVHNHDELRLLGRTAPDGTAALADDVRYGLRLAGYNVSTY
jgi:hypothetical protein